MNHKKLNLQSLAVKSFITNLDQDFDGQTIMGGRKARSTAKWCKKEIFSKDFCPA